MKRWTMLLPVFCLSAVFVMAQVPAPAPAPGHNDGILGLQLIAWSEMQKPQPVPQQPQPVPPPDTQEGSQPPSRSQQPDTGGQQPNAQKPDQESQESTSSSVTGTILKVAGKYVLQTSDNVAYQLDSADQASQYEGKRVKVTGTLDRATGILHVTNIELLS